MYPLLVFLTSAGALILEIAAGRLIAPYVGMSLYTWTAIIAVVLAGLSAGHWIGGRLAGAGITERSILTRITGALVAATFFTLLTLPLLRTVAGMIVDDLEHPVRSVLLLTMALFFLPSLFVGVLSPIATKAAIDRDPERAGPVIGHMFAAGAVGSIAGTLAAGFIFISLIGTTGTVLSVAVLYGALALIFGLISHRAPAVLGCLIALGGSTLLWGHAIQAFTSPCTMETDYFCIRIDRFAAESNGASRVMVLDHLVHSINDRDTPDRLHSPYIHFVDEIARRRYPPGGPADSALQSAFFVGGGGYTLPRSWQHTYPDARLVVAEIDPAVTKAAIDHLWFDPSQGSVDIVHADARVALRANPPGPRFDIVFGDAFHDISVPPHLVTEAFAKEVADRLRPSGFFVSNIVDSARTPMFAFVRTLGLHFGSVELWLSEDVSIDDPRVTYIVLATDRPSPMSFLRARIGLSRTWFRWPPDDLTARLDRLNPPVLTDTYAPVERLLFADTPRQ